MSKKGKDLIHVSVYYNSFNTRHVVNKKVYEVILEGQLEMELNWRSVQTWYSTALTSAIGGQISLFLGISIAMLFEVFEIILDLTGNIINWALRKPLGRPYHVF